MHADHNEPNRSARGFALLAAMLLAVGCTGDSGSQSGAALSIKSATAPDEIAGQAPPSGSTFEQISLTLHNDSSSTPLSTVPMLFTLETDRNLVLMIAAQQTELATPCIGTASVAVGGSLSCDVVFELPTGQSGTTLAYDDLMGHSASKAVPAATATNACIVVAGFANLYATGCTTCVSSMCSSQLGDRQQQCSLTSCSAQCANKTPTAGCACFETCDPADCWTATETANECIEQYCAAMCK